jgi:hypothetical protein
VRFAGEQLQDRSTPACWIIRVSDVHRSAREQLRLGVADQIAQCLVDPQESAVQRDVSDADHRLIENGKALVRLLAMRHYSAAPGVARNDLRRLAHSTRYGRRRRQPRERALEIIH